MSFSSQGPIRILFFTWIVLSLMPSSTSAQDSFREQLKIYDRDDIHSIHKRLYSKDGRHELTTSFGGILNNDSYFLLSAQYQYHFFEALALEGQFGYAFQTEDDNALTFGQLSASFSPIYGKISWFTWAVLNFDLYGIAGAGIVQYKGLQDGTSFMGNVGIGTRVFINEFLATRIEFRDYIYNRSLPDSDSKITHNYAITAGISLFFPFRQDL
jgi:outer membrane beta-barrel protein